MLSSPRWLDAERRGTGLNALKPNGDVALLDNFQEGFSVTFRVINRIVSVFGFAKVLEVFEEILHRALVERTKIC